MFIGNPWLRGMDSDNGEDDAADTPDKGSKRWVMAGAHCEMADKHYSGTAETRVAEQSNDSHQGLTLPVYNSDRSTNSFQPILRGHSNRGDQSPWMLGEDSNPSNFRVHFSSNLEDVGEEDRATPEPNQDATGAPQGTNQERLLQQLLDLIEEQERRDPASSPRLQLRAPKEAPEEAPKQPVQSKAHNVFNSVVCCQAGVTRAFKSSGSTCLASSKPKRGTDTKAEAPATVEMLDMRDLMLGQQITTVTGVSGRVAEKMEERLVLLTPNGALETVQLHQVTVLAVTILGARGHEQAQRQATRGAAAVCTCKLVGKPATVVKTKPATMAREITWAHEAKLLGYKIGDKVEFTVTHTTNESMEPSLLGTTYISSESLRSGDFEGDLQLVKDGRPIGFHITVLVVAVRAPPA